MVRHNPSALVRIVFLLARYNNLLVLHPGYARLNYSLNSLVRINFNFSFRSRSLNTPEL